MKIFVKPALAGAKIPDPVMGDDLPPEGRVVESGPYWQRLQDLGDEIIVVPVASSGSEPPPPVGDQPPAPDAPTRRSRLAPPAPKPRDEAAPVAESADTSASAD